MKTFIAIGLIAAFAAFWFKPTIFNARLSGDVGEKKKNVIFILIDDLGFNDISVHGNNEVLTPNIDSLFYSGVALDRYYTPHLCSPTRSSLMTGRYAHHIGMQHEVTWPQQPWGLGMDQKTIAQFFKESGYKTHMIGKWHLGIHQHQYWPHKRGFDTAFGSMGAPYVDYWSRSYEPPRDNFPGHNFTLGYDWRLNDEVVMKDQTNEYVTDVITNRAVKLIKESDKDEPFFLYIAHVGLHRANEKEPLQYKKSDWEFFSHITDNNRRKYACMLKSVDDSVGQIIKTLAQENKLEDTIIALTSDNGGPTLLPLVHNNSASNFPLRGMKGGPWEGGIRVPAVIFGSSLPSGIKRDNLFHVSDWLPTLNTVSGANFKIDRLLDGMDQSSMIKHNEGPFRMEVETIDQYHGTSSFIRNQWKLVNSSYDKNTDELDIWSGTNNHADRLGVQYDNIVLDSLAGSTFRKSKNHLSTTKVKNIRASLKVSCTSPVVKCSIYKKPCLFNIISDPCERTNLADDPAYREVYEDMLEKFSHRVALATPKRNVPNNFNSDPSNFGGVWNYYQEDTNDGPTSFGDYAKIYE